MMKKSKNFHFILLGIVLTCGVLISLFAFEEGERYPFPEDPLKGSKLFVSKGCIECHTIWGIGDTLGPDLAQMSREQNLLQLAGLLWSHSPKMIEIMQERGVSRPTFTPQEMGDLMGYIYYFNYFDQPGNFIEGERLFVEKGCAECHFVGENGGRDKMSLDDYGKYISPSFLATGLWNHSPEILSEIKRLGLKQPEFKGQELAHLLAYLRGAAINQDGEIIYAEPGSPKRGEDIFKQKKCNACHAVWGEGGRQSSDLGRRELRLSLIEIAGKIWSHSGQMWQEMKRMGLQFPIFSSEEMADMISYLYFIQFYDEKGDPEFSPIFLASSMWNHAIVMEDMLAEKNLAWPRFSGNEMRDLVSYVKEATKGYKEEKRRKATVPSKEKVLVLSENRFNIELARQGKRIYEAKACHACHEIGRKP
jgi:mono/diheme cytochrome c family protein